MPGRWQSALVSHTARAGDESLWPIFKHVNVKNVDKVLSKHHMIWEKRIFKNLGLQFLVEKKTFSYQFGKSKYECVR
jgi:hypothetical protein